MDLWEIVAADVAVAADIADAADVAVAADWNVLRTIQMNNPAFFLLTCSTLTTNISHQTPAPLTACPVHDKLWDWAKFPAIDLWLEEDLRFYIK